MKKKTTSLIMILFFVINVFGQTEVNTRLESVKVYISGAEMTHSAKVNLRSGNNEIIFKDFAQNLNPQSIRIQTESGVKILSVVNLTNYLSEKPKPRKLLELQDSLEKLNLRLRELGNRNTILSGEYDMIIANKAIGGSEKGVSVDELKKLAEFYNKRGTEIKTELIKSSVEEKKVKENIDKLTNQINEMNNTLSQPQQEISVSLISDKAKNADFSIIYYTYSAGWNAEYDIRINDIAKPIEWVYKGKVFQNTGMDWKNIDIVLSNNNPSYGLYLPDLDPKYLNFIQYESSDRVVIRGINPMSNQAMTMDALKKEEMSNMQKVFEPEEPIFTSEQKQNSVEFEARAKYNIPADGKEYSILLTTYDIPAEYEYKCVPAVLNQAVLTAKINDWSKYSIIPANANIYFENAYVGQTHLNTAITDSNLSIPVGKDKLVNVKRERITDFTESKFLSSNIIRSYKYETTISNGRKNDVKLLLKDQIPVSQNEDIEVVDVKISGGLLNKDTGIIEWNLNMKGGETVKKSIEYSVKYPGDKKINGL
ncbi:MAG: DUF4139 domain-containing protein [Ignavibacteria bacterium]|nr:DUF4139 domain-containing protein [Ignavibacteria bacterium]